MDEWMNISFQAYNDIAKVRARLNELKTSPTKAVSEAAAAFDNDLEKLQNGTSAAPGLRRDQSRCQSLCNDGAKWRYEAGEFPRANRAPAM
jgi:hypothetical protein